MARFSGMSVLLGVMVALTAGTARAATITYEFSDAGATGAALTGLLSGSHTVGGVQLTATAAPAGATNGAIFYNQNAPGYFGVNAEPSSDDTDQFDDGSSDGSESMIFSFDTAATLTSIEVESFTDTDSLSVSLDGGGVYTDDGTGTDLISIGEAFTAGQQITLAHTGGNGFGLVNIVIETIPTPAALPAGLGLLGLMMVRRQRM